MSNFQREAPLKASGLIAGRRVAFIDRSGCESVIIKRPEVRYQSTCLFLFQEGAIK
jgi:hypothetical protein